MWAAKLPGEGAALSDACEAMVTVMAALGVAVDGGKDSLSMAARVGTETVQAPGKDEALVRGKELWAWPALAPHLVSLLLVCRVTGRLSVCCLPRHHGHCDSRPQASWRERYGFVSLARVCVWCELVP